jgi:tripartite-type tricarboxylate transporter receptor subunit TctC
MRQIPSRRAIFGAFLATPAVAQGWSPRQPLRCIVTFAAGGSADQLARRLAVPLSETLGQPVVVENRPGAGGNIGMEAVARAAPDGHVFGMGAPGPMAINPALPNARVPFDPARDFTPVIHLADQANVLLCSPGLPFDSLASFRAWAAGHLEEPFGSPGSGTSNHLTGLAMSRAVGARWQHVPYRGSAPAHADLLSGTIRLMVDNIATALPFLRDGRMKAALVSTQARSPLLPEVPALGELGVAGLASWQGIFAPAGLPGPVLARLNAAFAQALAHPGVAEWLRDAGASVVAGTPEAFGSFLAAERSRWASIVRENNVTVD